MTKVKAITIIYRDMWLMSRAVYNIYRDVWQWWKQLLLYIGICDWSQMQFLIYTWMCDKGESNYYYIYLYRDMWLMSNEVSNIYRDMWPRWKQLLLYLRISDWCQIQFLIYTGMCDEGESNYYYIYGYETNCIWHQTPIPI